MDFNITKTYIPINDKMESIQHILLSTLDPNTGTYPVGSVTAFELVEIARLYTDINLPEEITEAYDYLAENRFDFAQYGEATLDIGRYRRILALQIEKLEKYQTSAYGILDAIKHDYNNLNFDVEKLKNDLANAEGLETVKAVVEKLG